MGFIHLLSLFAACHAEQAVEGRTNPLSAGREANKDVTARAPITTPATAAPGDDGASSTHGRMLARKTTRSLVVKHVHKWMNNFNPVNLEPSALVYAVKWDELLGSEIKIVQWFFKLSVIFAGFDVFAVLGLGILWNILGFANMKMNSPNLHWIWTLYSSGFWYLAGSLTLPTLYALLMVPD